ncbi:MAG: UDP-glucose 4-epimerase GalE [Actinomycetota bacterium]
MNDGGGQTILVTGGAGYIGSHTCVELLEAGYDVVVIDNLDNGSVKALDAVRTITGQDLAFHEADVADRVALGEVFAEHPISGIIHFAGLKAVGESVAEPRRYYEVNVGTTLALLEAMQEHHVDTVVFSSSATVYSPEATVPLKEDAPTGPINPYGQTKHMIEQILRDVGAADPALRIALLRYFNPVGAHSSGSMGEDPSGIPNNLMPYVMQVAVGKLAELQVFGDDYDTVDGTGVRDYIHVVDLARGHVAALRKLLEEPGVHTWNLGTGNGTSVLEIVAAASRAVGHDIPYKVVGRRPGDLATSFADPTKAQEELGWRAERTIDNMVHDHWNWQRHNPDGYEE